MKSIFSLILSVIIFVNINSCTKSIDKDIYSDYISTYTGKDTFTLPKNYVVLKSSYTANSLDKERSNSYQTEIFAKFSDESGNVESRGDIKVGDIILKPNKSNLYEYHGNDNLLSKSKLALNNKRINISYMNSESLSEDKSTIPVIEELMPVNVPNFPTSTLDKNSNLPLLWNPDPNNEFQKVQIQIDYFSEVSRYFDASFPVTIQSVVYTIDDNGYFVISKNDLSRFPVGTYVRITVSRASTNNTGDVAYLIIADAHTIPLKVVANPPLSATFSLTTSNTNPCNFSATAYASGGRPGYGYEWSTYIGSTPENCTVIGYENWVTGTGNCSTTLVNTKDNSLPPDGPNDMYLKLKVTDANLNTVTVVKKLKFTSGTGGGGGGGGGEEPVLKK